MNKFSSFRAAHGGPCPSRRTLRAASAVFTLASARSGPSSSSVPPTPDFGTTTRISADTPLFGRTTATFDLGTAEDEGASEEQQPLGQEDLLEQLTALEERVRETTGDLARNRSWLLSEGVEREAMKKYENEGKKYRKYLKKEQMEAESIRDKLEKIEGYGGLSTATEKRLGKIFKLLGNWDKEESASSFAGSSDSGRTSQGSAQHEQGVTAEQSSENPIPLSVPVVPRGSPASSVSDFSQKSSVTRDSRLVQDMEELVGEYREFFAHYHAADEQSEKLRTLFAQLTHDNGDLKRAVEQLQREKEEGEARLGRLLHRKGGLEVEFGELRGENEKLAGGVEELRWQLEMVGRENSELKAEKARVEAGREGDRRKHAEKLVMLERERVGLMDELNSSRRRQSQLLEKEDVVVMQQQQKKEVLLQQEVASLRLELEEAKSGKMILKSENERAETELVKLEKTVAALEAQVGEKRTSDDRWERLDAQRTQLRARVKEIEDLNSTLQKETKALKTEKLLVEKEAAKLREEKAKMEQMLAISKRETSSSSSNRGGGIEDLQRRLKQLSVEKSAAEAESSDLRAQLAKVIAEKNAKALEQSTPFMGKGGVQQLIPVEISSSGRTLVKSPIRRCKSSASLLTTGEATSSQKRKEVCEVAVGTDSAARSQGKPGSSSSSSSDRPKDQLVLEYTNSPLSVEEGVPLPRYTGAGSPVRMRVPLSSLDSWTAHRASRARESSGSSAPPTSKSLHRTKSSSALLGKQAGAGKLPETSGSVFGGRGPLPYRT